VTRAARLPGALASLLLSACATIMNTPQVSFTLETVPAGASYELRDLARPNWDVRRGTTPDPQYLARGVGFFTPAKYQFTLSKEGYQTETVLLKSSVSSWYYGNIFLFIPGWICMLVCDPPGAIWDIETPGPIALRPLPAGPPAP